MVSVGPFSLSLVVILMALAVAAAAGSLGARKAREQVKVLPTIVDMAFIGLVAARLGFVIEWFPQYWADPWSILRIDDGGFLPWMGVLAAISFAVWRARRTPLLRRPLLFGTTAGIASWLILTAVVLVMQQSAVTLPATPLTTLTGASMRLSSMSGKPMVVNLWATWCPPCRREMPVLAKAQQRREDVTFAFVNQGEARSDVASYLETGNLELENVFLDSFSAVAQEVGSRGLPTTLFFDAGGRLIDTHIGGLSEASLASKLQRFGPPPAARPDSAVEELPHRRAP